MTALRLLPLLRAIHLGALSPEASIAEALARVARLDGDIGAFVRLAPSASLARAAKSAGPLRGVPLGIKDIFDTQDMATEHGSPIYRGHRPRGDAALVALARMSGAAPIGKTATTEFASLVPAATRNPHDRAHTPGGSSSGSAAAVAAGMVAGAFGSQTGGSLIRPAAFCGVAGYKPSFRLLPTVGMKTFAWSLDTAGLFAATVEDVAMLAEILSGRDLAVEEGAGPASPRIGLFRSGIDARLAPDMAQGLAVAARHLEAAGARVADVAEPEALALAREAHLTLQDFEAAQALAFERTEHAADLSAPLRAALERGAAIAPPVYDEARRSARNGRRASALLFDGVDALLAPSALGTAPRSLETTGDPVANVLWTLTGNPCVNVPGLVGANGLPLGISVVARFGRDREALAIAALLERSIAAGR